MNRHRINLLPEGRLVSIERTLLVRFGVVVCGGVILLILVASALLIPTRLALTKVGTEKQAQLARLETSDTSSDQTTIANRLDQLLRNVTAVKALSRSASASTALRNVLSIPRTGVALTSFVYTPAQPSTLVITGIATTRENLHDYQAALQTAAFVRTSQLPVSSYAKNVDVPFTITLTLTQ